jgi:trimeric autotransporter adhesin
MDQADDSVMLIELSGANDPTGPMGLMISGAGATVRGLTIDNWRGQSNSGVGVEISGAHVTIAGNFIGTDASGETRGANGQEILIDAGTADLTIGGTSPADRNVIAGNFNDVETGGKFLATGIDNLKIVGNLIGIDAAGETALVPTAEIDKSITLTADSTGLIIGGAERNLLDSGFEIDNQTDALIQGNFVGTDKAGTTRVAITEANSPSVPLTADEFSTATITPAVDNVGTTLSTVASAAGIRQTIAATSSDCRWRCR